MTDLATPPSGDAPILEPNDPPADPPVDPGQSDPPAAPPADPPSGGDWRTEFATNDGAVDDKLLKFLGRFHSPAAAIKAWKQTNDEIATGKYIKPPGDDATEAEVAAWRKTIGVPDKPEGYLEKSDISIGDVDRPFIDKFLEKMHATDAPPKAVDAALKSYFDIVQEQQAQAQDRDIQTEQSSVETLREEWPAGEYKRNLTAMTSWINTLPKSVQSVFHYGRMPVLDDKGEPTGATVPVGYDSDIIRWATAMALEANPLTTVVPGAGANQTAAVADELADLKKQMADSTSDYWKGPKKDQLQARYRELIDAQEKLKAA